MRKKVFIKLVSLLTMFSLVGCENYGELGYDDGDDVELTRFAGAWGNPRLRH